MRLFTIGSEQNINSVSGFIALLFGIAFFWFTFLSPETVDAGTKANYCLIGFFAALSVNLWSRLKDEKEVNEQMTTNQDTYSRNRNTQDQIDDLWREFEKCRNSGSCNRIKNTGCMGDEGDHPGF